MERLVTTLTLHDDGRVSGLWRPLDGIEVPPPAAPAAELVAGTWALQQIMDAADLDRLRASIVAAITTAGIRGLSARFPLRAVFDGRNFIPDLVEACQAVAADAGVAFMWRTMAGRHTPPAVLDAVRTYSDPAGARYPAPFETDGAPAMRFVDALAGFVEPAAAWSRERGVSLLHFPWFGHDWAELWHGTDVRGLAGYSPDAFVAGHAALWDLGWSVAGADLMIEFPLSGHGPLGGAGNVSDRLAAHMAASGGPDAARLCAVSANGWGCILTGEPAPDNVGEWGNPDPATERSFDVVWTSPLVHAVQAIQPEDYGNWPAMFADAERVGALYVEVYAGPSFSGPHAGELSAAAVGFTPTLPGSA
jgi:hypothetical protein